MNWCSQIAPYNNQAAQQCVKRWDSIAKPLGSLGLLEKATIQIAGLTGNPSYTINKRGVVVMCADNGVVAQGVTQTSSDVTAVVARNMTTGDASVCRMACVANADIIPVDMGINTDMQLQKLLNRRIAAGTQDISLGAAMSKQQATDAIQYGIDLVKSLKEDGYTILLTGEMGIGNTTTSSAMASVMLGVAPAVVTGKGAGLSSNGLLHKIEVIETAIAINRPNSDDALDVLAKLGGFDIAGLVGIFLGGAIHRIPVIADGLISSVAALCATRLCSSAKQAILASHASAEPAGRLLLDALELSPFITAGMYLGEGSGAVAALPLLDMAYAVYGEMPTFEQIQIESYQPLA